jgi:uncharacterized protein YndB with AHSA1/START domain
MPTSPTTTASANSDRIEKQVHLRAPIERVWRAVSDAREFGAWFGVTFDAPFAPGRRMAGTMSPTKVDPEVAAAQEPYEGRAFEITVDRIEPPHLFSFRWHPFAVDENHDYSVEPTTLVVCELKEADGGGTLLRITESGFDGIPLERRAKAFEMNGHGWTMQAKLVAKYLADAS